MIRETAAMASWALLAGVALTPDRVFLRTSNLQLVLTAGAFFGAAALTRYWLQETHSRYQILAFAAAAVIVSVLRLIMSDRSAPLAELALNAGSSAIGVLVVKLALEGFPL